MHIQNGLGIEKILTDEETKKIIECTILPEFKPGDYYQGVINGMEAIVKELE